MKWTGLIFPIFNFSWHLAQKATTIWMLTTVAASTLNRQTGLNEPNVNTIQQLEFTSSELMTLNCPQTLLYRDATYALCENHYLDTPNPYSYSALIKYRHQQVDWMMEIAEVNFLGDFFDAALAAKEEKITIAQSIDNDSGAKIYIHQLNESGQQRLATTEVTTDCQSARIGKAEYNEGGQFEISGLCVKENSTVGFIMTVNEHEVIAKEYAAKNISGQDVHFGFTTMHYENGGKLFIGKILADKSIDLVLGKIDGNGLVTANQVQNIVPPEDRIENISHTQIVTYPNNVEIPFTFNVVFATQYNQTYSIFINSGFVAHQIKDYAIMANAAQPANLIGDIVVSIKDKNADSSNSLLAVINPTTHTPTFQNVQQIKGLMHSFANEGLIINGIGKDSEHTYWYQIDLAQPSLCSSTGNAHFEVKPLENLIVNPLTMTINSMSVQVNSMNVTLKPVRGFSKTICPPPSSTSTTSETGVTGNTSDQPVPPANENDNRATEISAFILGSVGVLSAVTASFYCYAKKRNLGFFDACAKKPTYHKLIVEEETSNQAIEMQADFSN